MNFEEFSVSPPGGGKPCHCRFHSLTTGISPRHSDTVDVKFLVNGKAIVIALPHSAFAEYRRRTGQSFTDTDAIQIAGLFLKSLLERGERVEEPTLSPSSQETLELGQKILGAVPR